MGENKIEKRKCPNWGKENFITATYCSNCKTRLNYGSLTDSNNDNKMNIKIEGEGFTTATKVIAWIELVCSFLSSIIFFIESISDSIFSDLKYSLRITSFCILISGIIIFILLMTIYYISKNVINIIKNQ